MKNNKIEEYVSNNALRELITQTEKGDKRHTITVWSYDFDKPTSLTIELVDYISLADIHYIVESVTDSILVNDKLDFGFANTIVNFYLLAYLTDLPIYKLIENEEGEVVDSEPDLEFVFQLNKRFDIVNELLKGEYTPKYIVNVANELYNTIWHKIKVELTNKEPLNKVASLITNALNVMPELENEDDIKTLLTGLVNTGKA